MSTQLTCSLDHAHYRLEELVVAHHARHSLTHGIAARIGEGISTEDHRSTYDIADLYGEGFDPRLTAGDLAVHHNEGLPPPDIRAEQQRIERADALVLVYPVYWWSMPALLKGWIDRVFSNGWAFEFRPGAPLIKKLGHLPIHLLGVGGADPGTYSRHGYAAAMRTHIDHGIFNYCGAKVITSELMLESETAKLLESHLYEGSQTLGESMHYGVSVTDSCLGWGDTEALLTRAATALARAKPLMKVG